MDSQSSTAQARILQAIAAFKARNRGLAGELVADLVKTDPPIGPTWGAVSRMAESLGEISSALTAAGRLAAIDRGDVNARLTFAALLAQYGRMRDASGLIDVLLQEKPGLAAAWHLRGVLRSQLGEVDGAIDDFRRAIALATDVSSKAQSLLSVSEAKRFTDPADPDLTAIQTLLDSWPATAPPIGKAALSYALGKANDDLGFTERAFSAYASGAALRNADRPHGGDEAAALVQDIVSNFTADFLKGLPTSSATSRRPIFVLGPPRSGTTLVEQILVSHSLVSDGAELNLFSKAAIPIAGFSTAEVATFARADPGGFSKIGEAYLGMLDQRFGTKGHVVDKTLSHSRFLGVIHQVLPNAKFIWLQRDPEAVAWSIFRTWFAQGIDWSWSLERIAQHLKSEDRLHDHWSAVLGDALLTVPYEGLVEDSNFWVRQILDHVDLPFEPGVEDFHLTDRAVTTASFAQVRRPIYGTSTGAWRAYRAHLEPFSTAYRS